jgi:hypothetical protein
VVVVVVEEEVMGGDLEEVAVAMRWDTGLEEGEDMVDMEEDMDTVEAYMEMVVEVEVDGLVTGPPGSALEQFLPFLM